MNRFTAVTTHIAATLIFTLAAATTAAAPPPPFVPDLSDRAIGLAVETELLSSQAVESHRIDAACDAGVVTLSGRVDNLLAKRHATRLAQQIIGVKAVVNQIVVVLSDRSDRRIAQDIRAAWLDSDAVQAADLRVSVDAGRATVIGKADSHAERRLAEDIAAGVVGVVAVDSKITMRHDAERSDEEIHVELTTLLDSSAALADATIDVDVNAAQVVLTGHVATARAKAIAEDKAWIRGVEAVDARGVRIDYDAYDGKRRRQRLEQITDEKIVDYVTLALQQDPRVVSYLDQVTVESDAGSVTLTGRIGRLAAKEAAEHTARSVIGVWRVRNHLKVRWDDDPPTAHQIIDNVQAALERDPYVARHGVRVHCRNAHVSLYGMVDTEFEKKAAGWIAGIQKGVVHVNNYLGVAQQWEPKPDAEIKADIEQKLRYTFFDKSNDIDVTVEDGVAILRGEVDTWRHWQTAMNKAVEAGARRPHNLLKVRYHPQHGGDSIYLPR